MSMLTADFMPRGSVSHVLAGLDERAGLVVDELDAATKWAFMAEIDARALVPTQEEIDLGNLAAMLFAAQPLPPIRVVAVVETRELRILDGHHRACLSVLRGEKIPAWVAVVSGVQVQDVLQGVGIVADVGAGVGLSGGWV